MKDYFSTFYIIKGLSVAIFLSFFIYSAYFGFIFPVLNTVTGIIAIYFMIVSRQKTLTWSGFFVGIFWFYWIGLSFKYYNLSYLIPFVILAISITYALFFWILSYPKNIFYRAILLLFASYAHPFEFTWFKPELMFTQSYIGVQKWQFMIVLLSICASVSVYRKYHKKLLSFFLILLIALSFEPLKTHIRKIPFSIYLYDQKIPENIKWNPLYTNKIIKDNIKEIKKEIKNKKDMIILNESAFPIYLNLDKRLLNQLKYLSRHIMIVTGALSKKGKNFYNSTYYFIDGKIKIANKVVLVPFGEKIPLPAFLAKYINKEFFGGASDFKTAKKPTTIIIKGIKFTNAICYETTENIMYKNHPKYIIAISNNAWFTPSIEPTLQNILIRFYARKFNTTIIHSANMGISGIF